METRLTILPIAPAHKQDWKKLWRGYLDFYEASLDDEIYEASFARISDPDYADCDGFIAFIDGKAAGIVNLIYHVHNWQLGKTCYLQDLFIAPEFRKNGIARKLIETVYHHVDETGKASGVYWMTQSFNHKARALYDDIGTLTPFVKYKRP